MCLQDLTRLFHIITAADRTLLSAAVPMVLALPRGGAAMFTRSTPGCGILDGPSLSVAKTEKIRRKSRSDAAKRAWATKRARTI